jgi:hypothetical protein
LDDGRRSIVAAHIAPRFQEVRLGNVPVAERTGLVVMKTEMRTQSDLANRVGQVQIDGRGVNRVSSEDHEETDGSRVHLAHELGEAGALIHRPHLGGLGVDDRRADVAKRGVHRMRERMYCGRLMVARNDQAAALRGLQILDERIDPLLCRFRGRRLAGAGDTKSRCDSTGKRLDVARAKWQAMIRFRTRVGRRAFDGIQAVALCAVAFDAAARRERARMT